jgi:hypothetical protein
MSTCDDLANQLRDLIAASIKHPEVNNDDKIAVVEQKQKDQGCIPQPTLIQTNVAPAATTVGSYVFFFATSTDERIYYNRARLGQASEGWFEVGGNGRTKDPPSAAAVGTYIFIVIKGLDGNIYVNQSGDLGHTFLTWNILQ